MTLVEAILGDSWPARLLVTLFVACVYGGAILLNNEILFPALEFDRYRYLLFVPAGLKLLVIMLFGWRGVIGAGLGRAAVTLNEFPNLPMVDGLVFGASVAIAMWTGLALASRLLRIGYPWPDLRWPHLLVIVVLASLFDAVAFNLAMVWIGHETLDPRLASDMVKGFAGRVVGAFAFMLLALDLKRRLLRTAAR